MKSLHHSSMTGSVTGAVWTIWVDMVVLLINSPLNHASCLCNLLEIFQSTSRPSHLKRYHWGMWLKGGELGDFGMETVFNIQSILGFHLCSQGISRMTCCHPRLRAIRLVASLKFGKRMLVWAFHLIVPLALVVLLTLYA